MNYITYHKSDVLGEYVRFVDNTKPILNVGLQNKDHLSLFSQIDYTSIPEKRLTMRILISATRGEYSTSGEAAKDFNITRSPIKNNINKKFTQCIVNGLPVLILFCRNTLTSAKNSIAVVVVDKKTNTAYSYSSIADAKRAINMGSTINSGTIKSKYIMRGKLYKNRFLIVEASNYNQNNTDHLEETKIAIEAVTPKKYLAWIDSQA